MSDLTRMYKSIFDSLEQQIAILDKNGKILEVNQAWQRFGSSNGLAQDYSCVSINYLATLTKAKASGDAFADIASQGIFRVLHGDLPEFNLEYPCHTPQNQQWFSMRICPLVGEHSQALYMVAHQDITARKLAEIKLEKLAMEDPLTGLSNRRAYTHAFSHELKANARDKGHLSLLLIDIDHFKSFNDKHGHAVGDQCLIAVGEVLASFARRPHDLAARLGGDEFALILGKTELSVAQKFAADIIKTVSELQLNLDEFTRVTVSIGVVSLIPDNRHRAEYIFQQADNALYLAKNAGKNKAVGNLLE